MVEWSSPNYHRILTSLPTQSPPHSHSRRCNMHKPPPAPSQCSSPRSHYVDPTTLILSTCQHTQEVSTTSRTQHVQKPNCFKETLHPPAALLHPSKPLPPGTRDRVPTTPQQPKPTTPPPHHPNAMTPKHPSKPPNFTCRTAGPERLTVAQPPCPQTTAHPPTISRHDMYPNKPTTPAHTPHNQHTYKQTSTDTHTHTHRTQKQHARMHAHTLTHTHTHTHTPPHVTMPNVRLPVPSHTLAASRDHFHSNLHHTAKPQNRSARFQLSRTTPLP